MFEITYLSVVVLAALPLAGSLLRRGAGEAISVHRLYCHAAYIAIAILAVVCFDAALRISLENYWFAELNQSHRFWLSLEYRVGIFLVILFLVGLFVVVNLWLLCRLLPVVPKTAPWIVGFAIAGFIGYLATPLWVPLIRFLGATTADVADPVFGKDLSFYLLALPLYDDIVDIVITILLLTIVLWAVIGFVGRRAGTLLIHRSGGVLHLSRNAVFVPTEPGNGQLWRLQGMGLAALLCLALGISRLLARYHLVVAGHSKVVAGASYADINFWIPGYGLIVVCWWMAAAILTLAILAPRFRAWLLIRRSRWLTPVAALAVILVGAFTVPAAIEALYVGPNQITLELPYLIRSIAGTREAYNLDGPSVEEHEFAVSAVPLTRQDLDRNAATLQDARIWDWRALEPQLQQIQGLRPYYSFAGVDIDRYAIDGAERQVMITARELNLDKLPDQAKVWVNLALKYTHGYGAVAVPVNEMDSRGNPVLWAHDIPCQSQEQPCGGARRNLLRCADAGSGLRSHIREGIRFSPGPGER